MFLRKLAFAAGFILCLASSDARADEIQKSPLDWSAKVDQPATHEVRDACESKNASDQAFCYGMIMGAYDANFYFADLMESTPLCIPADTTPEQLKQAFLDVAKLRSDQLMGAFSIFFYTGMNYKFPCGPNGQTPASKPVTTNPTLKK